MRGRQAPIFHSVKSNVHYSKVASMTSETQEKSLPFIVRAGAPQYKGGVLGWIVILSTWITLYFWGVTQLVDGFLEWLSYNSEATIIRVIGGIASTTLSSLQGLFYCPVVMYLNCVYLILFPAGTVEFGSGKYYALCAFGGVLSCGITHTAIVPLDLVKCRIQVCCHDVRFT